MKKIFIAVLFGFILAQACDYGDFIVVKTMQDKCYHFWTEGNEEQYQTCMDNEKTLGLADNVLGFNFVYSARQILCGY